MDQSAFLNVNEKHSNLAMLKNRPFGFCLELVYMGYPPQYFPVLHEKGCAISMR